MNSKKTEQNVGWAKHEFGDIDLGDTRLGSRLIKLADRFAASPESPINQACQDWAETKAAYRFFQNDSVRETDILFPHIKKTVQRSINHKTILAIQDSSYFSYTPHKKTTGLGVISKTPGTHVKTLTSMGVIMHTSFAVTTDGLPLGILNQKIFARQEVPEELKLKKKRSHNISVPIEEKESIRWLEALRNTEIAVQDSKITTVTVCDREGDFYEFLELANQLNASFLVRAAGDRIINKSSRYTEKNKVHLWNYLQNSPKRGTINVEVPARDQKPGRVATLETRFSSFTMNPSRNLIRHKTEDLPDLILNAVYVVEINSPAGEDPLEWMLLTNLPVTSFEEAVEKVRWYCLRWRIETFHKILKSGLKVEQCRLQTAERLIRYLTVMSIIAWRIFWITLIARSNPDESCDSILAEDEWKILYKRAHLRENKNKAIPNKPPCMKDVVRWIAMLGGFLARKGDGEPGVMSLWRGWKRLCDMAEGWSLSRGD